MKQTARSEHATGYKYVDISSRNVQNILAICCYFAIRAISSPLQANLVRALFQFHCRTILLARAFFFFFFFFFCFFFVFVFLFVRIELDGGTARGGIVPRKRET